MGWWLFASGFQSETAFHWVNCQSSCHYSPTLTSTYNLQPAYLKPSISFSPYPPFCTNWFCRKPTPRSGNLHQARFDRDRSWLSKPESVVFNAPTKFGQILQHLSEIHEIHGETPPVTLRYFVSLSPETRLMRHCRRKVSVIAEIKLPFRMWPG